MFVQRDRMRELMKKFKQMQLLTVVGGSWATVSEDDFMDLADVVFIGEADYTWPQFLKDWLAGSYLKRYEQDQRTDVRLLPVPKVELLAIDRY